MVFNLFKKFFDYNEREVGRLKKRADEVNALEDKVRSLKDADFPKETEKLREEIQKGTSTLDETLPFAFALVREAARRDLGQRHYDVQIMAGVALYEGKIAEQKTGEGKTLSATTALYLHALTGKGAHLVTVNDYLARRDAGWMGGVFHFLGLTTSAIISDKSFIFDPTHTDPDTSDWRLAHLKEATRKEAYLADVTYGINSEYGFDYLRDNMATHPQDTVQRGFYYAIIDEADSVLIDEARTPHIISAPYEEDTSKYYSYAKVVRELVPGEEYVIDEKLRTANLTEKGVSRIESILGVSNIYEKDFETLFHIEAALKAVTLFKKDKEYIVADGQVVIVDEFTGRLLHGRRFSEGIHQAIEAKENAAIQKESKNLATVSLQNYFRMYERLAGMTGTAQTEAEEFNKIYKTEVIVIPTHMGMVRRDNVDLIYKTEKAKFDAVVAEVAEAHKSGRPVLVGTTSIEKNEQLSALLKKRGIAHNLLNAKNHEQEATIIAEAGEVGAVTVATNMAGRGVDIILGGEPPSEEQRAKKGQVQWQKNHDKVVAAGGLYVMGTERHESRRIDNQLRGRSGRQGDPGDTTFFVALEDDLMRIFGGEQISKIMNFLKFPEEQALTHPMVSRAIEQAQTKVEGFNFDIRKHLVEFDDVLNKQREIIYTLRRKILFQAQDDPKEFKETVVDVFSQEAATIMAQFSAEEDTPRPELTTRLKKELDILTPIEEAALTKYVRAKNWQGLEAHLVEEMEKRYTAKTKNVGVEQWHNIVRLLFITTIDRFWTEHLTAIETLREGINLRAYGQLDPLTEYKNEAFSMFERLIADINFEATRRVLNVEVEIMKQEAAHDHVHIKEPEKLVYKSASVIDPYKAKPPEKAPAPPRSKKSKVTISRTTPEEQAVTQDKSGVMEEMGIKVTAPGSTKRKIGRNDPCWCGSGKKYKKCHLEADERS